MNNLESMAKTKSYGDVFVKKIPYTPVRVSEEVFEQILKKGNWRVERRINDLVEDDIWLRGNIHGEENLFAFSQNDYFPVYVETSDSNVIYRYCTANQIVKLRYLR